MNEAPVDGKSTNTVVAFLLALFLGSIGVHNVYIGRWKRGLVQFFLVVLTFGGGIVITWPWSMIEAVLILIGRYNFEPVEASSNTATGPAPVQNKREYLITAALLTPLLAATVFTLGGAMLAAILFYFVVGWLWNAVTRVFITSVLPVYASVFSSGKKFLIRFSEYRLHPTMTRTEVYRATRKLSLTAVFVLVFLVSLLAQSNIGMVTEGAIPDAMLCQDGTVDLIGDCESGNVRPCDADCVMENSTPGERIFEAYVSADILALLMVSPFLTMFVGPVLVLRYSSLSIVDKKTRSIAPIGEKANDLTNVAAGIGSIVLFFQTAWRIAREAMESGDLVSGIGFVGLILVTTLGLVLVTYPLIWLPMLKFTKAFEGHVLHLDNTLMESKGIEIHELTYSENELRITPLKTSSISENMPSDDVNATASNEVTLIPPQTHPAQSTDEHGFEWVTHEGAVFYRRAGSNDVWSRHQG